MTPVVCIAFPQKNFFQKKIVILLICLHLHFNDHIRKQTFVGKNILHSFIHFFRRFFFLIFHFKHVLAEVGKVVMEPVFSMERDIKAQLCL